MTDYVEQFSFEYKGRTVRLWLPDAEDVIQGQIIRHKRFYECEMLNDLIGRLHPGSLVLDVGANIGNHTVAVAIAGLRVRAYEPGSEACKVLLRNIELNWLQGRVTVCPYALSDKARTGKLITPDIHNQGNAMLDVLSTDEQPSPDRVEGCDVRRLDDEDIPEIVRCIKLDVEGHELNVLAGATGILARDKPIIYAEVTNVPGLKRLAVQLAAHGYLPTDTFNFTATCLFRHISTIEKQFASVLTDSVCRQVELTEKLARSASETAELRRQREALRHDIDQLRRYGPILIWLRTKLRRLGLSK